VHQHMKYTHALPRYHNVISFCFVQALDRETGLGAMFDTTRRIAWGVAIGKLVSLVVALKKALLWV
jgi:hypothetical protein